MVTSKEKSRSIVAMGLGVGKEGLTVVEGIAGLGRVVQHRSKVIGCVLCLKRLKDALKAWNKDIFGNVFDNICLAENRVDDEELRFQSDPSEECHESLHQAQVELLLAFKK
ncbi:hypothetical protein ACH5RR_023694 [Cinchona calisaya]|uniref:Uncharacterized protein n=1 Tax=Cinchona calisaya TaxID=153742 RepID=A0ABD2ZBC4_9GENT